MNNKAEYRNLFNSTGCLSEEAIGLYIDRRLSAEELDVVIQHTASCKLCYDALEGAGGFASSETFHSNIDKMRQSDWRLSIDEPDNKKRLFYGVSSIAATIVLLIGLVFIVKMERTEKVSFDQLESPLVSESIVIMEDSLEDVKKLHSVESETEPTAPRKKLSPQPVIVKPKLPESNIVLIDDEVELTEEDLAFEVYEEEEESLEFIVVADETEAFDLSKAESNTSVLARSASAPQSMAHKNENVELTSQSEEKTVRREKGRKKSNGEVFYVAEITPMFRGGGIDQFNKFVVDSLKTFIPDAVWGESLIISFVIDSSGNVDKVKLISGTSSKEFDKLVLEFVKTSPVWVPGYSSGNPVEMEQKTKIVLDTNTLQMAQ
jgi:hypothetical protein